MTIDFETPMTFYELIGIVFAVLALIIPFIKWLYEKWFKRLKIDFLISDVITIYFNRSGSYINLGGVYKVDNKTATIKNISAKVIRKADNAMLNLTWSTFPSPTVKEIGGQYEHSFETAHPFSANVDSLTPAFIEFIDEKTNISEEIAIAIQPLYTVENLILNQQGITIIDADRQTHATSEYSDSRVKLYEFCFWKTGKYEVELITKYDNTEFVKKYNFELNHDDANKLQGNIETLLVNPIADRFNTRQQYYSIRKNLSV